MMKLYGSSTAPNLRRVNMFAAEKGIELESVLVDLLADEHKIEEFINKNPSANIPILELDNVMCISETVAICRFFESLLPTSSLFGKKSVKTALIEMQHRFIEFELVSGIDLS